MIINIQLLHTVAANYMLLALFPCYPLLLIGNQGLVCEWGCFLLPSSLSAWQIWVSIIVIVDHIAAVWSFVRGLVSNWTY